MRLYETAKEILKLQAERDAIDKRIDALKAQVREVFPDTPPRYFSYVWSSGVKITDPVVAEAYFVRHAKDRHLFKLSLPKEGYMALKPKFAALSEPVLSVRVDVKAVATTTTPAP